MDNLRQQQLETLYTQLERGSMNNELLNRLDVMVWRVYDAIEQIENISAKPFCDIDPDFEREIFKAIDDKNHSKLIGYNERLRKQIDSLTMDGA